MNSVMNRSVGRVPTRHRTPPFALPDQTSLLEIEISSETLEQVPESVARENSVLPVHFEGDTIVLATADNSNIMLQDKLRFLLNRNVRFVHRRKSEVDAAIAHHYGDLEGEAADSMLQEFTDTAIDFCETDTSQRYDSIGRLESVHPSSPRRKTTIAGGMLKAYGQTNHPQSVGDGWMYYTISEGKRVLVYRRDGQVEVLKGPARVWKGLSRFEPMQHFVAHPSQYLSILFRNGREQMQVGPAEMWMDPREHEMIEVHDCLELAAKEAVVIYGASDADIDASTGQPTTSRRVFNGPGLFAPRPGEWLHRFSWHAANGGSRGEEKRPHALQFEKLCLMPDQMYHDVRDVRTADDAVLTIRLMIFFELIDIDRMLDTTHDPIGDFINAATSDVVEFTGKRSFEEFKQQTEQLNEIDTYHQLLHRAEQCGYQINNVVYRGYGAPDSLQAMHDEAIASRTRLQLDRATERQAQELEDYQLTCQMERAARRREEQLSEVRHDLETKRLRDEAERKEQESLGAFQREQLRAKEELAAELRAHVDLQTQAHLEALRTMGVDLTAFLTQSRADQVIEVRGEPTTKPELHLTQVASKNGKSGGSINR